MQNSTMKLTATAFSALLVGMSAVSPVAAEDEDIGYYFGLELGVTSTPDRNISGLGGTPLIRADLDRGYVYGGVIGYDFGNFAAELEILRFGQDISTLNTLVDGGLGASLGGAALTPGAVAATGEVNGSSWMLNVIYQF